MANNPFQTPSSPWALPGATLGTLFNTSARVTRLQSRWASPTGAFTALKTCWASTTIAQAITGYGYALKYLAAGSGTDATNAYNAAIAEAYANETTSPGGPPSFCSQSAPYVYAWCKGALSGAQNTNLLNLIETNNGLLETSIGTLGKFLIDGSGNGNVGMPGYVFGICATTGAGGPITDRRANMRNLVQNMCLYINQIYNDGIWTSYDNIWGANAGVILAYHIATGEESLLASRCPAFVARGEILARMLSSTQGKYYDITPHNSRRDLTGRHLAAYSDEAWCAAMTSDVTRDTTMAWIRDQQLANSTPTAWTHLQLQSDPTWTGFLFHDTTLVGVSPTTAAIPTCKSYLVNGVAEFRGGWNQATDVVCNLTGGAPGGISDHTLPNAGCIQIRVGPTWLVCDGYNYGHRASTWESGGTSTPSNSTEVGAYSMRHSGLSFSPSATQATREDRDGSAAVNITANSQATYPLPWALTNGVRQAWFSGTMGSMYDDGQLAKVTADISAAFPQCTSVKRTVGYQRGANSTKGTFVVYDQFTAAATIDHIRANFWSKFKPTPGGAETVLTGSTTAGVVRWAGDHVIIKSGSVQATIQMVTPFTTIHGVGGAGFESWFDGYPTNGSNLDFVANGGGDGRNPTEFLWMNNAAAVPGQVQWRTSFQTSQSTALGEMLFVITVDAIGTTAPSYTKSSALALISTSPGAVPSMPGFSTFAQKQGLDFLSGNNSVGLPTLYAALFTTLPLDDGTGGVEVSGTGYTRVALSSSTFGLASGGAPATTTNASAITFPVAGASWGTVVAVGFFDALTNGNYWGGDYLGTSAWQPFTCSSATPGVLTSPAHGLSNADLIEVTAKYGGTLPTTGGSWGGQLTVANSTTDTFTAGVNTTGTGDGMFRKILSQAVASAATVTIGIGSITLSLG